MLPSHMWKSKEMTKIILYVRKSISQPGSPQKDILCAMELNTQKLLRLGKEVIRLLLKYSATTLVVTKHK